MLRQKILSRTQWTAPEASLFARLTLENNRGSGQWESHGVLCSDCGQGWLNHSMIMILALRVGIFAYMCCS